MALNVVQFYKINPRLPFQFKTKWYTSLVDDDGLTYCVKSINLPKIEIENNVGFSFFGNAIKSIPTYNPGARKIEITFEENDNMLVSTFIDKLVNSSFSRNPYYITIQITQFDEHFQHNTTKGYVCHLSNYEEPSFKRDGQAQPIDISATFIIDTVIPNFTDANAISGTIIKHGSPQYNPKISSLIIDKQNQKFEFGDFKFGNDNLNPQSGTVKQKTAKIGKDSTGHGVASVWNLFANNANDPSKQGNGQTKLQNLMLNEKSWINMAFMQEKSVGEQKDLLKKNYGLSDADFKDPATLMQAMNRAEMENRKKGGKEGEVWGSVYACSGATGWAYLMTTQDNSYVMPQDAIANGKYTYDFMQVVYAEKPELFEKKASKSFKSQKEAEQFIKDNSERNDNISVGNGKRGHQGINTGTGNVDKYSADHAQGDDFIPESYGDDVSVTIYKFKGKK